MKFPWGVNFKFNGVLHHSIDRVWVVAKIPIPAFKDVDLQSLDVRQLCLPYSSREAHKSTRYQKERSALRSLCESSLGQFGRIAIKERFYRSKVQHLMFEELPRILPQLNQTHSPRRVKRGPVLTMVAPLIGKLSVVIWEQISSHLNRKRERAMIHAMTAMTDYNRDLHNTLQQYEKDLTMYGEYNIDSLEKVAETLHLLKHAYKNMAGHIKRYTVVDVYRMGDRQLMYSFQLAMYVMAMEEKHGAIYRELINSLEEMLKGIATLSKGYLPPELFPPSRIAQMVDSVQEVLQKDFPEYTLAIKDLRDYYDMKLVTFAVDSDRNLVITFPVLITHQDRGKLELFELETVPVPVADLNPAMDTYTQAIMPKPYIAVGEDNYIELRIQELRMCKYIHFQYYCEELFLEKHMSKFSCASALYYDLPLDTIMENCEFKVMYNTTVTPAILDGGDTIVLANIESPKDLKCDDNFPLRLSQHSYVLLNRSVLCFCDIDAGLSVVRQSVGACLTSEGYSGPSVPVLYFTFNYAFFGAFEALLSNFTYEAPELPLVTEEEPIFPLALPEVDSLLTDLHLDLDKMKTIVTEERFLPKPEGELDTLIEEHIYDTFGMKTFKVVMAFLSVVTLAWVVWMAIKHAKLKTMVGGLSLGTLPMIKAEQGGLGEILPSNIVCQNSWVTIMLTTLTLIGVIVLILREIKRQVFLKGYKYSNSCQVTLFVSTGGYYVPVKVITTTGAMHMFSYNGDPTQIKITTERAFLGDQLNINWGNVHIAYRDSIMILPTILNAQWNFKYVLRRMLQEEYEVTIMIKQNKQWCIVRKN